MTDLPAGERTQLYIRERRYVEEEVDRELVLGCDADAPSFELDGIFPDALDEITYREPTVEELRESLEAMEHSEQTWRRIANANSPATQDYETKKTGLALGGLVLATSLLPISSKLSYVERLALGMTIADAVALGTVAIGKRYRGFKGRFYASIQTALAKEAQLKQAVHQELEATVDLE